MRSTEKINDIVPPPTVVELKLDAESLGKLIRAKALKAAAMHVALIELSEKFSTTSSQQPSMQKPFAEDLS